METVNLGKLKEQRSTAEPRRDGQNRGQLPSGLSPEKAPSLTPAMSWDEAGRAVLAFYFAQLLANEQGTVDRENPEALHDMRVAAARMRVALRSFRRAFPKADARRLMGDIRWLDDLLGRLRDLDVFIEWLRYYQQEAPEPQCAFIERLIQERQAARARERASLLAGLHSQRYQQLKQDFDCLIQTQVDRNNSRRLVKLARAQIERERKRVWKSRRRANAKHLGRLHRLRMEFKRLRYTGEFFASLTPDRLQRLTRASRKIQSELGGVHDAGEYVQFLKETRRTQSSDPGMDSTLGTMIETLKRQESQQYKAFVKSYKKFRSNRKIEKELDTLERVSRI